MNIRPDETEIVGHWIETPGGVEGDEACNRVHHLIEHHLKRLAIADAGWSALYRDPGDGRLWEFTYPQGHLHAGGPPALFQMSEAGAQEKYGTAVPAHS